MVREDQHTLLGGMTYKVIPHPQWSPQWFRLSARLPPEILETTCARVREDEVDGEVLSTLSLEEVREV